MHSNVDRKVYLGTCWKFDVNPHIKNPADKHWYYWIAQYRDAEDTVLGTRLERFPDGTWERTDNCPLMPKLGMTQIDVDEYLYEVNARGRQGSF